MSAKAVRKKKFIQETAARVFREKGYRDVTMKDIVDACGISRGGLYLYYGSVEEIFLDVLKIEAEDTGESFAEAVSRHSGPAQILELFLEEQKKELLKAEDTLTQAAYEYAFSKQEKDTGNYMRTQFREAVIIIEHLIREGVQCGDFACDDPAQEAVNIMYIVEGMKIASRTMGITEEEADGEIRLLINKLTIVEQ